MISISDHGAPEFASMFYPSLGSSALMPMEPVRSNRVHGACLVLAGFDVGPDLKIAVAELDLCSLVNRRQSPDVIGSYIPDYTATAMPHYRVYAITSDGHVTAPPTVIACADDQEAISKAAQLTNGEPVELWQDARFIVRFPSDEG
jgi:hypothetical protein